MVVKYRPMRCDMCMQFCTSPEVSDKTLFSTFARTKPHDSQISMAVVSLLLNFNWTTIAFVYSDEELLLADALLEVRPLICVLQALSIPYCHSTWISVCV